MSNDIIRVGIMGPGRIVERVYKDFHRAEGLAITAVGSRSPERARQAAQKYGAAHAFGSYEELAACPDVDLVYVATPHNFHMDDAILAMEHGKHVLCEKPLALNEFQVKRMIDCARRRGVFLMEGMWTRLFPASVKLRALLDDGALGRVRHVSCDFCLYAEFDPQSRLFSRSLAGGALLDVGIYTLAAASMALGYEPTSVSGVCQKAATGVDAMDAITLQYAGGETAQLLTGVCACSAHALTIMGEKGRVEMPDFWHPTRFSVIDNAGDRTEYAFERENEGFRHEFMHVRECILKGLVESPVMPHRETLALSRVSTQLRRMWGVVYPEEEA